MRHSLKTLQPLASVLPGDEHIYKWTYGHVSYKESGAPDALYLMVLHASGIGASVTTRRVAADTRLNLLAGGVL